VSTRHEKRIFLGHQNFLFNVKLNVSFGVSFVNFLHSELWLILKLVIEILHLDRPKLNHVTCEENLF